jgi:lipopolysaccharide/colanic/teichoic acid biosynthesis glycosyltransferase
MIRAELTPPLDRTGSPRPRTWPFIERRVRCLSVLNDRRRRITRHPQPTRALAPSLLAAGQEIVAPEGNKRPSYSSAKRLLDIVGALFLLIAVGPLMLAVLLILTITTKGRPIYSQQRLGYRGRPFRMYKFRTMRLDAERLQATVDNEQQGPVFKNRHDPRITPIGRVLRKYSIDELPQFFNVLVGDLSLVGPRPPLGAEVAEYGHWQRRRLAVKPGLTCLWQVSGRSEIDFDNWVRMDLWYIRNQSLPTDARLLVKTPLCVISGRGAY